MNFFKNIFNKIKSFFQRQKVPPVWTPNKESGPQKFDTQESYSASDTDETDVIISNFMSMVDDMTEDDYTLVYNHGFYSNRRTAAGNDAKKWSAEQIIGYGGEPGGILENAINSVGREQVALNIQKNGKTLEGIVEQIIFAIYDSKYAKWGGGSGAYTYALQMEIFGLLTGGI